MIWPFENKKTFFATHFTISDSFYPKFGTKHTHTINHSLSLFPEFPQKSQQIPFFVTKHGTFQYEICQRNHIVQVSAVESVSLDFRLPALHIHRVRQPPAHSMVCCWGRLTLDMVRSSYICWMCVPVSLLENASQGQKPPPPLRPQRSLLTLRNWEAFPHCARRAGGRFQAAYTGKFCLTQGDHLKH